jgi:coenzyme F420-reducing hydrogenase beta subunit
MTASDSSPRENVCSRTVQLDLCIGCGVCAGLCPAGNLVMAWTPEGLLQPADQGKCLPKCRRCLAVCPFQDHTEDETALAQARFGHVPGIGHTPETGYYLRAYVGHAGGYRERGASGGLASWFLASVLESGAVDRVICVQPNPDPACLFAYAVTASSDEVRAGAKSAYYPVELSQAIHTMLREKKRYAVIGLPCSLKALRLAMLTDQRLQERVVVLAGLVCGQTKSRAFSEYLIRSQAIAPEQVRSLSFREKDVSRPASRYFAKVMASNNSACLPWSGLYGTTWLSGEFTLRACRFCDDAFAEVADVSFMDAWLPEYAKDGRGTSIVLARSGLAGDVIERGMAQSEISLLPITVDKVIASQAGVVEQKRTQLAYRLWSASKNAAPLRKRVSPVRPSWFQEQLMVARENLRATSHVAFSAAGSSGEDRMQRYHSQMRRPRRRLNALLFSAGYRSKAKGAISRLINTLMPR